MSLLSLAERMGAQAPSISLDAKRCVRSRDRLSHCQLCVDACPVGAFKVGPITFNEQVCVACGACLPVCPVGAITGDDGATDLVKCAAKLDARVLEIACGRHTNTAQGPAEATSVIRINQCLASLGAAAYVWLLGNQTDKIILRTDQCAACAIGSARAQIDQTAQAVRQLLPPTGSGERLVVVSEADPSFKERMTVSAKNPPMSRRDLFRVLSAEGPRLAAQALPFEEPQAPEGKTPPSERRRLINALRRVESQAGERAIAPGYPARATRLAVDGKCTACNVCARVCPTGALVATTRDLDFRLSVSLAACTDCGMCIELCEPGALQRSGAPTLTEFVAAEPVVLRATTLRVCDKCGVKFASETPTELCPICEFRRDNPFGSRRPARMQ